MKILFILGMYYPRYSANGLCCKNIVDECVANGWKVSCVVNAFNGNETPYELDGAKIYPISPRLSYRLQEKAQLRLQLYPKKASALKTVANVINKAKLLLFSWSWPYVAPLYTRRFYKKARSLYFKEHFDVVIGVYTPIDSLYAAYKLKNKFHEIKFIPYYLDALAGGWGPIVWSKRRREKRLRKWEQKIARKADAIISMQSSMEYHKNYPILDNNTSCRYFLDVPMMLSDVRCISKKSDSSKIALFAGSISYPRRNPIPLLKIFSLVCKKVDLKLFFVGDCSNVEIFQPYIEESNGRICLLGQKTHEEVLQLEKESDFLINIGNNNPYTIPSKIFEYMRFGKPISSTYSIDEEPSLVYLKKYGYTCFIDERTDIKTSAEHLINFIKSNENINIPEGFCQKTFYDSTPKAFVDTIKKILGMS